MMIWVMVLTVFTVHGVAATTAEFNSERACYRAAAEIAKKIDSTRRADDVAAICTPKQDVK
ncbi:hypothetical protein BcepIL02_gp36 [Burkholderia phage BcepIL02]|uniref:Uncharacterized protein n=1 Tax=Burkholderia phage BcepIL02 TaxID=2886898 RepID=C5IHM8_9CAUD|nr:hypothetical protein BcepIL02_gp36 [Burkholderia phage BcepIL02]ACR15029.1 hypothetical protein BcepIL02_gp36 [Burkholderia phage BcepIL02]